MSEIFKKVRLVAAPPPPFVGTVIRIKTDDQNRTYGIYAADPAYGSDGVSVDWGDGTVERVSVVSKLSHTYEASGEYEVRLSDDIDTLGLGELTDGAPYSDNYPRLVRSVTSNAVRLTTLLGGCFARSRNLVSVDLWGSKITTTGSLTFYDCPSLVSYCLPEGLEFLGRGSFRGCTRITGVHLPRNVSRLNVDLFRECSGLVGEVDVRYVSDVRGSGESVPFSGCTGITRFHFAKANEDAIRSSPGYLTDPTLGTGSAVCVFDL